MKRRAPLHWLSLLLVAALLTGCGLFRSDPPSVALVTLTDRVDETTKAAVRALEAFPKGTKQMYASVRVMNPRKGTRVEARWFYDKEGKGAYYLVDQASVAFDQASRQRHVAFRLEATSTFPSGAYKVQVFLDDKMVKETAFRVNE